MARLLRAIVFSTFALFGAFPTFAQGINPAIQAYAWASESQSASYTPNPLFSFNATGGAISAARSGTGQYAITFSGVNGSGGNVQVTAYASNAHCYTAGWSGNPVTINIRCVNGATLQFVDTQYDVLYTRQVAGTPGVRYVWADQASSQSYTPNPAYAFNAGSAVTATRSGIGTYRVIFAGVPASVASSGSVQVSAYQTASRCVVARWDPAAVSSGMTVDVRCYAGGSLNDTQFTLLFTEGSETGSRASGFAWANDPALASYTPNAAYSYANGGGAITATRGSTGRYTMTFDGLGSNGGAAGGQVQVSAYDGSGYCSVQGWGARFTYVDISVFCYDGAGAPADQQYTVFFVWPDRMATTTEVGPNDDSFALRLTGANPTTNRAAFTVTLADPANLRIAVYDVLGREVALVAERAFPAGSSVQTLDTSVYPAGVYTARFVQAAGARAVRFTVAR